MAKISTFYSNIFTKNGQKSPISPDKFANFAQNRPIFKDAKNRPNFAGDFCKKVVASLRPKIAHLAKNRHSWERWYLRLDPESQYRLQKVSTIQGKEVYGKYYAER